MSDNGADDDGQPQKRQKLDERDNPPDPPSMDVEEIGSQDTDDEERNSNAENEDDFLQVLDQLNDDQKAKLLGSAIEEYGKKLFVNFEEQRDDLLFGALQIDPTFVDMARAVKFQSDVVEVDDDDEDDDDDDDGVDMAAGDGEGDAEADGEGEEDDDREEDMGDEDGVGEEDADDDDDGDDADQDAEGGEEDGGEAADDDDDTLE